MTRKECIDYINSRYLDHWPGELEEVDYWIGKDFLESCVEYLEESYD